MPYLFKSPEGMLDIIVSCRIIVVESFYIRKLKKQKKIVRDARCPRTSSLSTKPELDDKARAMDTLV